MADIADVPGWAMCPITHACMRHAVVAADGFVYDHNAIVRAIRAAEDRCGEARSPMTNLPLAHTQLRHDPDLQARIDRWRTEHEHDADEPPPSPLLDMSVMHGCSDFPNVANNNNNSNTSVLRLLIFCRTWTMLRPHVRYHAT